MKRLKRLTALLLCAACVCALAVAPPPAAAAEAVSTFPDVTDPQVGRAVEALRMMGVIDGSGGLYKPQNNLTRAQFCKMAVLVMGRGDEAEAQASRTIFNDVPGNHWARGYVNLAAQTTIGGGEDGKGGTRLMMGLGDGNFAPDRAVTYGEAVTILLRILNYTKEAAASWPHGAVSTAAAIGLDDGFTAPKAGEPITRAQAALLFRNMLTAPMAGSKELYVKSLSGGDLKENWLLVSLDAKTDSGLEGAVQFYDKTGKQAPVLPAVHAPSSFLKGKQGTAVLKDGKLLTFLPNAAAASRTLTVESATVGSTCTITGTDGSTISLSRSTTVLDEGKPVSYGDIYAKLRPGASVLACFTASGAVDYLYIESFGVVDSAKSGTMVAKDPVTGNPFAELTAGATDYKIVKNGVAASLSDLKQYDVGTYNAETKTLYVSDFRVTSIYAEAEPTVTAPTRIKLSLYDKKLDVLDCALDDLAELKLGESITFLFSTDGKIAGAMKQSSKVRPTAVGYVDKDSSVSKVNVHIVNAPVETLATASGEIASKYTAMSDSEADRLIVERLKKPLDECIDDYIKEHPETDRSDALNILRQSIKDLLKAEHDSEIASMLINYRGSLVTVAGARNGVITMSRLTGKTVTGNLDMKTHTLAGVSLAENVCVFEKVGTSDIYPISLNAITVDSVPASKIVYQRTNYAGKIDLLVINDVTGDLYTYGIAEEGETDSYGNRSIKVKTNGTIKEAEAVGGTTYRKGQFIGLVESVNTLQSGASRTAASVALKSVEKVTAANFNLTTNRFFSGSIELPIWEGVQCYNAQTKDWFSVGEKEEGESDADYAMRVLNACLAYSSNLTVYYDRDPNQGGKVRIVVAN